MMQFEYDQEIIQIHIVRSKRKTICMSLNQDGSVTVKAPRLFPSDKEIGKFVEAKKDWIFQQREKQQERQDMKLERRFETDYSFPYLGTERLVEMSSGKKIRIVYEDDRIKIQTPDFSSLRQDYDAQENKEILEKLRTELKKWYKKKGKEYLSRRVEHFQNIIGVTVTDVSIKSRKSQWGSCDSNGCLTFSWRLVMAKPEAIDYVVIHELCHRKHMDHSKAFWNEVMKYMPDYKVWKQWLEENSVNLNIQ